MFQKLFRGFCAQVKRIDTFSTLRDIMNPPSPENYQRLVLSVQQLIQSQPINWKMVSRLQELKDQQQLHLLRYNIPLDIKYLLQHLKEQPIDPTKQRFVVDLMDIYFTEDDEFFANTYKQILRMQDLQFPTLIKLLDVCFNYPEFVDQNKSIPILVQNILSYDNIDVYDIVHAFNVFNYSEKGLNEENKGWLNDLKSEICEQIIKFLPCFNQKLFRQFIQVLRSSNYESEPLKLALDKYFQEQKISLKQSTLVELLNLYNTKFYNNDQIKYQIFMQINLLKIRGANENSMINKFIVPKMPLPQQELMANLITLSGIQLDHDFLQSHAVLSNSQKREALEKLDSLTPQIEQIVTEIMTFINSQFIQMMKVIDFASALGVRTPQLMIRIRNELQVILQRQFVDPNDLLQVISYMETCNVQCNFKDDMVGMRYFNEYIVKEPYTKEKINYLLQNFAFTQSPHTLNVLQQALAGRWTLEQLSRLILIFRYYKIPITDQLKDKYNAALLGYTVKFNTQYDQILFYKYVEMADWSEKMNLNLLGYYAKGRKFSKTMRKASSKNLESASFYEVEIKNTLKQFLPPQFKLLHNQMVRGTEVDFIIQGPTGKCLFLQIHGQTHCYLETLEFNFLTVLENFKLGLLGTLKTIKYDTHFSQFDEREIPKLLSLLM